ncbi:hypothetical protein [Symbiopectobacterium purcellii]|uniref:hypothetical protein n=1 Tax=Symbiopectobacterium purcellii TaxID=2871826 RepID=UPI003F878E9B
MGAGQKGFIPTPLDKLLFILLYLKCYPTYDLQGLLFGLDGFVELFKILIYISIIKFQRLIFPLGMLFIVLTI